MQKASFLHVFLQKIYEYTHEFKKLIRAHQVLIISYQTPRKIMESDENCEFRGSVEFFFKSGAKFLETPYFKIGLSKIAIRRKIVWVLGVF